MFDNAAYNFKYGKLKLKLGFGVNETKLQQ